jgi:hypothetical protein
MCGMIVLVGDVVYILCDIVYVTTFATIANVLYLYLIVILLRVILLGIKYKSMFAIITSFDSYSNYLNLTNHKSFKHNEIW